MTARYPSGLSPELLKHLDPQGKYPSGYWAAINRYFDPLGTADVSYLRTKLKRLRCMPRGLPPFFTDLLEAEAADLKEEILKAVHDGDLAFIEKLTEAMRPEEPVTPVRATLIAFERLLGDAWPTKRDVRKKAEEILRENGFIRLPLQRHWPRIFAAAGLSDLPNAIRGPGLSKPAIVYYLRITGPEGILYKIGVTNRSVASRFELDRKKITTLKTWKFAKASEAFDFERKIKHENHQHKYSGPRVLYHGGNTELFTCDVLGLDR